MHELTFEKPSFVLKTFLHPLDLGFSTQEWKIRVARILSGMTRTTRGTRSTTGSRRTLLTTAKRTILLLRTTGPRLLPLARLVLPRLALFYVITVDRNFKLIHITHLEAAFHCKIYKVLKILCSKLKLPGCLLQFFRIRFC